MIIKIKSLWHGQIGVHQKFIKEAVKSKRDLVFVHKDEKMLILAEDIRGAIKGISQETFRDKYKNELYKLVYFDWKPNQPKQQKLL